MNRVTPVFAAFLLLRLLSPVPAAAVDLATLLGNAGFEDDLDHSHWSATVKNANDRLDAPVVNPTILRFGETEALVIKRTFTAWPPNGEWGSQTFSFVIPSAVEYLSLAITGKNHKAASYVAFDVLVP